MITVSFLYDGDFKEVRQYQNIKTLLERLSQYPLLNLLEIRINYSIHLLDEQNFDIHKTKRVIFDKNSNYLKDLKTKLVEYKLKELQGEHDSLVRFLANKKESK